jgi:hypothetical protein
MLEDGEPQTEVVVEFHEQARSRPDG